MHYRVQRVEIQCATIGHQGINPSIVNFAGRLWTGKMEMAPMAKTEMTLSIERALRYYRPSETCGIGINKHRATHTAFEVPTICGTTAGGLVDCLRAQEYFGDIERVRVCGAYGWKKEGIRRIAIQCPYGFLDSEQPPERCDDNGCKLNYIKERGTAKILITAYEIKVTKSDFKSKNGHNFVGNCNYYVVPAELYEDVKDFVPEEIGIILYLHAGSYTGLRRKKECTFRPLTDEEQKWLVLSLMKRLEETTWKERAMGTREGDLGLW